MKEENVRRGPAEGIVRLRNLGIVELVPLVDLGSATRGVMSAAQASDVLSNAKELVLRG
jgi:hypothetical protein